MKPPVSQLIAIAVMAAAFAVRAPWSEHPAAVVYASIAIAGDRYKTPGCALFEPNLQNIKSTRASAGQAGGRVVLTRVPAATHEVSRPAISHPAPGRQCFGECMLSPARCSV